MSQNNSYYWYKSKKVALESLDTKKFIIFDLGSDTSDDILKTFSDNNIKVSNMCSKENMVIKNSKWAVVDKTTYQSLKQKKLDICYEGPFYKNQSNIEAGLSHVFYVKLKKEQDENVLDNYAKENKVKIIERDKYMPLWFTLSCSKESSGNALEMANLFYESNLFEASEPEFMIQNMTSCANDTYFNYQWNLAQTSQFGNTDWVNIDICRAHGITTGSSNIIVAVVDNGVEPNHPDLNIYPLCYDTESGDTISIINGDHGTSVAGIIGALKDNSLGVCGVAPDCPIMSISSTMSVDTAITKKLADGINFARENGASVINCSWYAMEHQFLDDAIEAALTQGRNGLGCVVVCAAGNNDVQSIDYPACSNDDIIVVGSCSLCGERKNSDSCDGEDWGSSYGEQLDIMAPGVLIPSTDRQGILGYNPDYPIHTYNGGNIITSDFSNQNYTVWFNGTSAATPHVSGVAALILSINPNLKGKYVNRLIESGAQKAGGYSYYNKEGRPNGIWCDEMGYGLLNAYESLLIEYQHPTTSILDQIVTSYTYSTGDNVYLENVSVTNGSDFVINFNHGLLINNNFNIELGSTFSAY